MKGAIRRLHSPDVDALETYVPNNTDFGFLLQIMIGPATGPGEESFDVVVCTLPWFQERLGDSPLSGRGYLFVKHYDFEALRTYLHKRIGNLEAPTWRDLANKISRLAQWEFEDYTE